MCTVLEGPKFPMWVMAFKKIRRAASLLIFFCACSVIFRSSFQLLQKTWCGSRGRSSSNDHSMRRPFGQPRGATPG